jgi:hypothetical protein
MGVHNGQFRSLSGRVTLDEADKGLHAALNILPRVSLFFGRETGGAPMARKLTYEELEKEDI